MLSIACRYWIQPISSPFSSYIHGKTQSTFMITWPLLYPRRHPYLVNQILWKTVLTKDCKLTETSTAKSHASWKTSSIYQCNIYSWLLLWSCDLIEVPFLVTSITKVGKRCPSLSMARGSLPSISISKSSQFYEQTVFPVCKLILELEMMKIK